MRSTITKAAVGLTTLAMLTGSGVALAASGGSTNPSSTNPAPTSAGQVQATSDGDNVQSGDQTSADVSSESQSGSEVAGNDGPGGHADEPGNANADHQFQGEE